MMYFFNVFSDVAALCERNKCDLFQLCPTVNECFSNVRNFSHKQKKSRSALVKLHENKVLEFYIFIYKRRHKK